MTHRVWKSASVDARLVAQKRRPHGRPRNVRRRWKLRAVDYMQPDAFGFDDIPAYRQVGRLKTVGR